MASLSNKIRQYVNAEVDFTTDVILQNDSDGRGDYIKEWNLDIAQPTQAQLDALETAADLHERQNVVRATRKAAYGSIEDQLDMQYKDKLNGTTTWNDHVAAVKSANPIPTE